jgi:hypothetical protein
MSRRAASVLVSARAHSNCTRRLLHAYFLVLHPSVLLLKLFHAVAYICCCVCLQDVTSACCCCVCLQDVPSLDECVGNNRQHISSSIR